MLSLPELGAVARHRRQIESGSLVLARVVPGASLPSGSTFTRADATTCATYLDSSGVQHTVAANVLRDGHFVGGIHTVLLEESRINLVIRSTDCSNASWVKVAVGSATAPAVTGNSGVDPAGNTAAAKVVYIAPGAGDTSALKTVNVTTVASSTYTGSIWIKAFAAGDVGKIILMRSVANSTWTAITLTNSWQRVSKAEVAVGTTSVLNIDLIPSSGSSSGTVTAFVTFGQLELGAFATSDIATTSAAVTRAVDALTIGTPLASAATVVTLYQRWWDLATLAWADAASVYTPNTTITPTINRAYAEPAAILAGHLSAAQCRSILGYGS